MPRQAEPRRTSWAYAAAEGHGSGSWPAAARPARPPRSPRAQPLQSRCWGEPGAAARWGPSAGCMRDSYHAKRKIEEMCATYGWTRPPPRDRDLRLPGVAGLDPPAYMTGLYDKFTV